MTPIAALTPDTHQTSRARRLLATGFVAGPIFVGVIVGQLFTRDGFDLRRQPVSLLSLGEYGWIQITNFVVAGLLSLLFAIGAGRALRTGPGHRWGTILLAIFGIGMIAGGVFTPDPALGFPVGTPDGIPDHQSWHSLLHAVAPPLAFVALVLACLVFARRFAAEGRRGWAVYRVLSGVLTLGLSAWPHPGSAGVRLMVAIVIAFAWLAALAAELRKRGSVVAVA